MNVTEQIYNIFDNEGKLKQLEYGLEAVYGCYQIIAIRGTEEIIFVSKKLPQQPLQAESHNSIFKLCDGLYTNITGLPADINYIVNSSISLASSKQYNLGCSVTPDVFTKSLAGKLQTRIQKSSKRSPAFASLIGGFENDVPMLYYTDMSAVEFPCYAYAAGEDSSKILKYLEKNYRSGDRKFCIQLGIAALLESIGKDAEYSEIQVGIVTKKGLEHLSDQEIEQTLQIIAESY